MTEIDNINAANRLNYLQLFKKFYASNNQINVDSIGQREFGVGIDKKINYRHKSFSTQREFQQFLSNETPRFVSHSVGRFEFPWVQPMEKKTLLSADLIFDLDSKPEEGHNPAFCHNCVDKTRGDTIKLVEDFLLRDFGLSQSDLLIVFSGSKGFHVHVRAASVQQLSSASRRILVDYITGHELTVDNLVTNQRIGNRATTLHGPSESATSWKAEFLNSALGYLENPIELQKKKENYLKTHLADVVHLLKNGNWDFFHGSEEALPLILEKTIQTRGVQVDSPVTFDVHRLIRVPGTLHGDTGFLAKPLSMVSLSNFDATRDATAFKGKTKITLPTQLALEFDNESFELSIGENEVPLSLAVLLTCRGMV